jgi:hypothetical protein
VLDSVEVSVAPRSACEPLGAVKSLIANGRQDWSEFYLEEGLRE